MSIYSPIGLPSNSPTFSSSDSQSEGRFSKNAKVGVAVAVLGTALLLVITALIILASRRSSRRRLSGSSIKAVNHVTSKWVSDEERNSDELKTISSPPRAHSSD